MSNTPTPRDMPTPRENAGLSPRQRTPQLSARSARGYQPGKFAQWGSQLTPRNPMCADPVHVCIRMRPPHENVKSDELIKYSIDHNANGNPTSTPRTPRTASLNLTIRGQSDGNVEEQRIYEFTDIFTPVSSDHSVEKVVVPRATDQIRQGYNAAIMCYGQTGSGKTHTVNEIIPKLVESLFSMMESDECKEFTHVVKLSYIQIYNNNVFNLLTESKAELGEALPRPKGTIVAEPMIPVKSTNDVLTAVANAQKRRAVAPHAMNQRSSRSHTLLTLSISKLVEGTTVQACRLTVADLAGSERLKKTGVAGDAVEEAIAINKSLSTLHRVIEAVGSHNAVPIRDSVLTLYLAQSLQDSYMFLIANIALEACNISETKSTLEFATVARKCVVQRMKSSVGNRDSTFEDMQRQLNEEIQMLRLKVEELQKEAELERSRNAVLASRLEQRAVQEETIRSLEGNAMKLNNLLREREEELRFLERRKEAVDTVTADINQRQIEKEEARETLASSLANGISSDDVEELKAKLERANDAFLWQEELFKAESEKNKTNEEAVRSLKQECHKMRKELLDSRQSALAWERKENQSAQLVEELNSQLGDMQRKFDSLEVQLFKERNDFKARQISIETFCSARNANDEAKNLDKALREQTELLDDVQSRLTSCEQELFETEKARAALEAKASTAEQLYDELWRSLSPAEKGQFVRGDRQPPERMSYDVVALRSGLNRANQKCEELFATIRTRDAQLEELELEVHQLTEARDERDKEFETLRALEEAHSLRGEQLEQQLEGLYTEIDAHCSRREQLEGLLKETHAEWEKLDHEFRESQKEINTLTNKLDEALQKLRQFEASNDELTARLREAEEQKDSFKKRRDAEHARVVELEKQLRDQELRSVGVKQMRDVAAAKNRHIWRELTKSSIRSDMMASRLDQLPGASATVKKKLLSQQAPSVAHTISTTDNASHAKQLAEGTKRRHLRFEVSQLRRSSTSMGSTKHEDHKDPNASLNGSSSAKKPLPENKRTTFSNTQKSPRGVPPTNNSRMSRVQQLAMQKQHAADQQAAEKRKQPPIPPLSLIHARLHKTSDENKPASSPPAIPPLSLGKRPPVAGRVGSRK